MEAVGLSAAIASTGYRVLLHDRRNCGASDVAFDGSEPEPSKERVSVQAARLVVALAVVAALALLVYWLFGQSG